MREKLIKTTKRMETGKAFSFLSLQKKKLLYINMLDFSLHPLSCNSKCTLGKFAHEDVIKLNKTYEVILLSKAQILLLFVMKFA